MTTENLIWTYAFNLIVNSFIAFLTITILIQGIITLFHVKQPRLKAVLLSIPLIKLGLDPFLYDFQSWALMHQVNPLEAEVGTRALSACIGFPTALSGIADFTPFPTAIMLTMHNGQLTFTLADLAILSLDPLISKGLILLLGAISLVLFGTYLYRVYRSLKSLTYIIKNGLPCARPIHNDLLIRKLARLRVQIIISADVEVPCAFGILRKWICLPRYLIEEFSQAEFEAVIAHELNHLCWYDNVLQFFCNCTSTLFWWVPSSWWLDRMEHAQERACDAHVCAYHIPTVELASAIMKTVKAMKLGSCPVMASCFVHGSLTERLQPLLTETYPKNLMKWLQMGIVGILAISFLLGRFWIF